MQKNVGIIYGACVINTHKKSISCVIAEDCISNIPMFTEITVMKKCPYSNGSGTHNIMSHPLSYE